jgi:Alpha/beta hydrolase domain
MKRLYRTGSLFWAFLSCALTCAARVERVEVLSRNDVLDGSPFGEAGAYEKVIGKVHFAVKPDDPHNRLIVDLDKAPRNANGEIEFAADVFILRPKDAARASGTALIEIPNRGGKGMLRVIQNGKTSVDPTTAEEFGDGFLMRRGVTVIWIGWQWDVRDDKGLMRLYAPVAHDPPPAKVSADDAFNQPQSITGLVRSDFVVTEKQDEQPLGHLISGQIGGTEYYCWKTHDPANVLTVRDGPMEKRRVIPRSEWEFVGSVGAKEEPGPRTIRLKGGFEPGKIYEVVYSARDPMVAGLGFAALRDFASYLKEPGNDAAPAKRIYAMGISQSGRFLRHFLYEGFNADEAGKQAIDGMFVHVAGAGMGSFNHRFAQPSRDAQPTNALFYPTDVFPFTDMPQKEPESGQTAGLLDRAKAHRVLPRIFYTNTSYEYWSRAGSLIHTTPDGKRDMPLMDNVRIYLLAGLQHFTGPFPPTPPSEPSLAARNLPNPNPVLYFWRALFVAMDDWVRDNKAPPESRYPKLADKTLVRREEVKFPKIPSTSTRTMIALPERVHQALRLDFGPLWKKRIITKQPPGIGKPFPVFVPQVDKDGNDLGGVRLPELEAPLATYTGWNLRDPKTGMPKERVSFLGSWFPLAKTKTENDSRTPIAERYSSRDEYLKKFTEAANKLVEQRFLLQEDVDALAKRGGDEWDFVTK